MCALCVEIQKGNITTWEQVEEFNNAINVDLDLSHYFDVVKDLIQGLPHKQKETCSCGAKYTSFPNAHLKYCGGG